MPATTTLGWTIEVLAHNADVLGVALADVNCTQECTLNEWRETECSM